jgi:hypothetical protein
MATVSKDIMTIAASEANAPPFTITFAEVISQTFLKGWPVEIGSGHRVSGITSDTPVSILGVAAQDFHNISTAGSATDPAKAISVDIANGTNIFAANVLGTSLADHVLTQNDIGALMGIQRDTSNNKVYLDSSVTGGASVRVITLRTAQGTDIGDTNGRVLFLWLPKYAQTMGTS